MHTPTIIVHPRRNVTKWAGYLILLLLFFASGLTSFAQNITGSNYIYVDISKNPTTGATSQYSALNGSFPSFDNRFLGTYAIGTGANESLLLQGGQVVTVEPTEPDAKFSSATLRYQVYPFNNQGVASYASINLPEVNTVTNGSTTIRTFQSAASVIDLIKSINAAGRYTIDIYLEAAYVTTNSNGTVISTVVKQDDNIANGGGNYRANFQVTGSRQNTSVWTGARSDNWFDPLNWSAGVPTNTTDAFIQYPGVGSTAAYPKIYANGKYVQSPTSNNIDYSNDPAYGDASVHTLSFGGTSTTATASMQLLNGNLLIYGDLSSDLHNLFQGPQTSITFASAGAQSISLVSGGDFQTVYIAGGGTKTVKGTMNIATELKFGSSLLAMTQVSGLGILVAQGAGNLVVLQPIDGTTDEVALLTNESEGGYVLGNITTRTHATAGQLQRFGGIGLTLNFDTNSPDEITVLRNTDQSFSGTSSSASPSKGYSIRRSFNVTPSSSGFNAELTFDYLDLDYQNIGPDNINLDENHLYLNFTSNGTSFMPLNYDTRDASQNILTKNVVAISTGYYTLGDDRTPLPVSLIAFNAQRLGTNGLLTWATAMERNNKGFSVEVSTDGINFRALSFVASNSLNSDKRLSYSFTDTETSKSGVRYYRLRQLDTDGTQDFSPVRVIDFNSLAREVATALAAYPNPYGPSDAIKLVLHTTSVGIARLRVSDLLGREVANQTFTTVNGATEVALDQTAKLSLGTYMAQVTLPSGEVKTIRIQKR
jgi:hypothetical protein